MRKVKLIRENGTLIAELKYNNESFKNFAKHSHEEFNIVALDSGKIELEFHKQAPQTLKANELAIFNPDQVHLTKSNDTLGYYSMLINKEWVQAIQQELFGSSQFLNIYPNILKVSALNREFINICQLILEDNLEDISKKIEKFIKNLYSQDLLLSEAKSSNSLLLKAQEYILQNIQNDLSVEDVAKNIGYTSAHLNRLFKEEFGLTLHAFLIDKRIQKAKELIKSSNLDLTQIAYEAGFFDQSHFIRNFKKRYSLSPKAYKK